MPNRSFLNSLSYKDLVVRTCQESWKDEVFGQSARLAFYFFFALFPLLVLLLMGLGATHATSGWREALIDSIHQILPDNVSQLLSSIIGQQSGTAFAGGGLLAGTATAVWAVLNGTRSIFTGLNNAYELHEDRSVWKLSLLTVVMTLCLCGLALSALAVIRVLGGHPGAHTHAGRQLMEWFITAVLDAICFALLYRFGPSLKHPNWRWSLPGAVLAALLWTLFTSALRIYERHNVSTQRIYTGLAPVATLLLWLYFTGGAIFLGAELNAVIAKAAREDN